MFDDPLTQLTAKPWHGSRVERLSTDAIATPFWWGLRLALGAGVGALTIAALMLGLIRIALWRVGT